MKKSVREEVCEIAKILWIFVSEVEQKPRY